MVKYFLLFATAVAATVFVLVLAPGTRVCEDCILQNYILDKVTKQPVDEMLLNIYLYIGILVWEGFFSYSPISHNMKLKMFFFSIDQKWNQRIEGIRKKSYLHD